MIRNVVLGRFSDTADQDAVDAALAGIAGLTLPGMIANSVGRDLALRDGGWSIAIVNDWADADSYRAYDTEEEHNRYRAVLAANCAEIARVQIEM